MISIAKSRSMQGIKQRAQRAYYSALLPSFLAGIALALMVLVLGLKSVPVVVFLLLILPWLLRDTFRLFLWLIVTSPILTLFLRVPLPAGVPDLSYDRLLVLFLLCVFLVEVLAAKGKFIHTSSLDILVLVYVAAQLSARLFVLWYGGTGRQDFNGLLDVILIPVILYWLVKNLLVSEGHLKWLLYALVLATLLICLTGLYEQAVGVRIFKVSTRLGGYSEFYYWQDVQGGRASGAMGNPAIYGSTLGMGILASITCAFHCNQRLFRIALLTIAGILLTGVFASYTRSAWLSVLVVLFAGQFFMKDVWKKTLPFLVIGLLVLIVFWDTLPINPTIVNRATNLDSITPRLSVLRLGWKLFLERPIFGWGSGALNEFGRSQAGTISHNIYLSMLVDGGILLFFGFNLIVGYLLMRSIRIYQLTRKGSFRRHALVAMVGNILIFLLSGLALELHYFGYFVTLFWISAGVIDRLETISTG